MTAAYAVSDTHGYVEELRAALEGEGLIEDDHWTGRDARLWFLGDFFDRGPDGIAVLELVRRLVDESDGAVSALIGNHEVLAIGMRMFGATRSEATPRTFEQLWQLCEGQASDQARLTDDHVDWLLGLPFVAIDGADLLMHADSVGYLEWGNTVEAINEAGRASMRSSEIADWWQLWRRLTLRYAYRGADGPAVARHVLGALGGQRIVHGHSIAAELAGVPYTDVTEAWSYADGLALAIDGGIYEGGPCLLTRLA